MSLIAISTVARQHRRKYDCNANEAIESLSHDSQATKGKPIYRTSDSNVRLDESIDDSNIRSDP